MRVRFNRIEAFLTWCANKVKDTVTPMSKGTLSKMFVKEQKLAYQPYYFSIYAPDDMLSDHIKKSTHSLDVQAKLMCLLSLPVDQEYFKALSQFATIKLDKFRRIIVYEHGETVVECEHRKFRTDKYKNFRETTENQQNESFGEISNQRSGTSTTSQTRQERKTQPLIANKPADVALLFPKHVITNNQQSTSSSPSSSQSAQYFSAHYDSQCDRQKNNGTPFNPHFSQHVEEEQHEFSYHSSWLNETSQSCINNNRIGAGKQSTQTLKNLETPRVSNPRFSENSDSASSISYNPRHQPIASTGEPLLAEILQKLELYFLYKCKPELMPLCLRIKEVKANEATFGQKIILPSTIKAFFEVPLRLMVATNIQEPIKVEQEEIQVQPLLLRDFFEDLKKQNLVEGLDIVIDSIQTRVGSQETISFTTIARVFLEIINNLALVC
ncbi:unnamed protein product [Caenorhabditis brenneri]